MSGFDASFGELKPEDVAWSRGIVEMIKIGGVWGIPRSGLVFTRTGENELTLTARMPWMEEMEGVIMPEQLQEQQDAELAVVAEHMRAAGIDVFDATSPEREETH